jgi:hypothetical protein
MGGTVDTTLGATPQDDLVVRLVEQPETADAWIIARECVYRGVQFPDAVGEVVRRDVWVTMKQGQASQVASGI